MIIRAGDANGANHCLRAPLHSSLVFAVAAYIIKPTASHVPVGVAHNQPFS